jgi:hypothetical protein
MEDKKTGCSGGRFFELDRIVFPTSIPNSALDSPDSYKSFTQLPLSPGK